MNIIEVKNLTKKFKDFVAVDNISFNIAEGEIFAFLGPNGAGKSTTIKMLTTLLRPTGGEIKLNGYNPEDDSDAFRYLLIGSSHYSLVLDISAVSIITLIFLFLGSYFFSKIQV